MFHCTKDSGIIHLIACVSISSTWRPNDLPLCRYTIMCQWPNVGWTLDACVSSTFGFCWQRGYEPEWKFCFISLGKYLEVGLLDLMIIVFQICLVCSILHSPQNTKYSCPHILSNTGFLTPQIRHSSCFLPLTAFTLFRFLDITHYVVDDRISCIIFNFLPEVYFLVLFVKKYLC